MADDGSRVPDNMFCAIARAFKKRLYRTSRRSLRRETRELLLREADEAYQRGEYTTAVERFDAAHALYAALPGTESGQADCLYNAGVALRHTGKYAAAVERLDAARALYATLPDTQREQAVCLLSAGVSLEAMGEYTTTVEHLDAARALYATLPDTQREQARCLFHRGNVLSVLGEFDVAIEHFDAARAEYATIPDTESDQADCLTAIAATLFAVGRSTEASYTRAQASSLRRTSERDDITQAQSMLMAASMAMSTVGGLTHAPSTDDLQWALDVFRKNRRSGAIQAACMMQLAIAFYCDGSPEEALSLVEEGRATALEIGTDGIATLATWLHALMLYTEAHSHEDEQEEAELIDKSLTSALEAALRMDRARFRLAKPSQRETWIRNRAEDVMDLAIELAAELNRAELVSDLIATWRTVGVLDLQISTSSPGPGDLDARTLLTSHLPLLLDAAPTLLADAGLPVPGNAPQADAPDDSSALAAAPPVGSQTALSGADLPRRPGPRLVMPHHRTALDTYSTVPLTTLSPDPEPVRATYR